MVDDIKQRSVYVIIAYSAVLLTFVSANCPKPALSKNTQVVPLRSDVNLTCPGCHGQTWWSRANQTTPLQHGAHLALTSVGYEDEDNYTCYDDVGAPACTVQLLVEDDIEEPKISCYIRYPTHNITCDWQTTRELRPHATVKLIAWKVDKNHGENVCSYALSTRKFICSAPYDEGNSERHTLSLCVIGRTDRRSSNTVESKGEGLVRPDPPINVTVTPLEEQPYKLRVSWSPTEPWLSDFYPLEYQVQYRVEGVPHVSNGTTLDVSYVINDALARRRHVVRVRAKEEFYGSWSAWSEEKVGTPWSAGNEEDETYVSTDFPEFIMTSAEDENPEYEKPRSSPVPHYAWAVAGVSFVLVLLLLLGILMRIREVKLVKLKGGLLRAFLRPARSGPTLPQTLTAAPLLGPPGPPPDGVTVTVPQTAD